MAVKAKAKTKEKGKEPEAPKTNAKPSRSERSEREIKRVTTETASRSKSGSSGSFYQKLGGQLAKTKKQARSGGEFWTPEDGKNTVRPIKFLHDGEEELYAWDAKHWGDFAGEKKCVTCLGKEGDCPICELEDEISPDLWNGEFANKDKPGIKARGRILMNVIVRGKGDSNDRLVVAAFAPSVVLGSKNAVGMNSFFDPEDDDFCDPLDEDNGRDFIIEKSGEGMKTRYKVRLANNASEVGMDVAGKDLYQFISETTNEEYDSAVDAIREMTDERGRNTKSRRSEQSERGGSKRGKKDEEEDE